MAGDDSITSPQLRYSNDHLLGCHYFTLLGKGNTHARMVVPGL